MVGGTTTHDLRPTTYDLLPTTYHLVLPASLVQPPEQRNNPIGFEALAGEVAIEALELAVVFDHLAAAQALGSISR